MLKGVLFDLGSTLLEFDNADWHELEKACLRKGYLTLSQKVKLPGWVDFSDEFLKTFHLAWQEADRSLREIRFDEWVGSFLGRYNITSPDGLGRFFLNDYYKPIADQVTLIDHAPEVLAKLKSGGLKLGVISNSTFPSDYHIAELEMHGLNKYFDFTVFSCDFGFRKPHTGLFRLALERLSLEPGETLYIGDRLREDVAGAKAAGLKAVLKFKSGRDYSYQIQPDAVIHHLRELPDAARQLFS